MSKTVFIIVFTLTRAAVVFPLSACLSGVLAKEPVLEEVAVVTELPAAAVEITHWDIALQTDLTNNRLKIKATCTLQNNGRAPLDSLDFDLLRAEKVLGAEVAIAKIARLSGNRETDVTFKRFVEEEPKDASRVGTREYPLVTRLVLSPVLDPGAECKLRFEYSLTCLNITNDQLSYKLICEPQPGMKEICLMADFAWFPSVITESPKSMSFGGRNFFSRSSRPTWQVTLTHPSGLEGMVLSGKLEQCRRAGGETVSHWRSLTRGTPQLFIGPAERVERKGKGVTVIFLLPRGRYNPELVDAVAGLLFQAYPVFTDWFGPLESDEIRIAATSGISGGHSAFLGMTVGASHFQVSKSRWMMESGKFFDETPVHELAHSWWPSSYGRGTKFLRESLSEFAAWHLARQYYGVDLFKEALQKYLFARGLGRKPLLNAESDEEEFAYVKGPILLDVLRQEMGDEVFFQTMREYVRRYRQSHSTFIDFVLVCNQVSQRDWMPFFYQWCYGKGCPAYHLAGFESKEAKAGWETKLMISNDGVGTVRCPLELRMEDGRRREVFSIPGGEWKTFVYRTDKKVIDVLIDPEETAYQTGDKGQRIKEKALSSTAEQSASAPGRKQPKRLVAWWKLDEADGTKVADSSGRGHEGTLTGCPRWQWQPSRGRIKGALAFDGSGDFVEITNEHAFDLTGAITVAAWIKVNRFDKRWQSLIAKGDTAWRIQRTATEDTLSFHCNGINSAKGRRHNGIEGKRAVNDGDWHHVVGTYDGATVSLYIDGVLDNSSEASGSILTNDFPVYIGGNSEATGRGWSGFIDEVCVLDGAIDANDVRTLYMGGDLGPTRTAVNQP